MIVESTHKHLSDIFSIIRLILPMLKIKIAHFNETTLNIKIIIIINSTVYPVAVVHCTCPEQHFWCYIVGRPHQRVRQTALVLPGLSPLQRLQTVCTAAVGWIFPFLTEVHAVLPHMVTWKEITHSLH